MAGRAGAGQLDVLRPDASIKKLAAVGFHQVKEDLYRKFPVSRRARGEEQQPILFPHRIRFLHLTEQSRRISKLRFERAANFRANRITTFLYTRADRGDHVTWVTSEGAAHL